MRKLTPGIAVVATGWGSRHGGVNSFSADFCMALARVVPAYRISCIAFEASVADIEQAWETAGVKLYSLDAVARDEPTVLATHAIKILEPGAEVDYQWWIGHDIITGEVAAACSKLYKNSRLAVIMHTSYSDFAYPKHPIADASTVAAKTRRQRELLVSADHAFAVGPLLFERLEEFRGRANGRSTMLIPGLLANAPPLESRRLHAITFGRFERSEELIKQAPLAVAAFARAVRAGVDSSINVMKEAQLTVIGVPADAAEHLRHVAEEEAGRVLNLQLLEYTANREHLMDLLSRSNLSLMLSWHEGFGLGAWEAIGAGVPLILSRNSGVYRLLDEIGGAALGCIHHLDIRGRSDGAPNDEDVEKAKRLILQIASDIPKNQADADRLRIMLRFQCRYVWDSTAVAACNALDIPTTETMLTGKFAVDKAVLAESHDVADGLAVASAQRSLDLARLYYHNGQYGDALAALTAISEAARQRSLPPTLLIDATIAECDVLLRVNDYAKARALIAAAAREASDRREWCRYIRARGIEDVILRDQGHYPEAVALATSLVDLAQRFCLAEEESARRKLGRSMALAGRWDEALKQGQLALEMARNRSDREDEAKARLVLGEAHRHGLNQAAAIAEYTGGRDLSGRAGNVDCYLWCVLGLADSLFLLKNHDDANVLLEGIERYLAGAAQQHPLETLHLKLSQLTVQHAMGADMSAALVAIPERYDDLGVRWPREYVAEVLAGDLSNPKRF